MQQLEVRLEDDLIGGPADEAVAFGIDGRSYEIDLNARHAADFRRQPRAYSSMEAWSGRRIDARRSGRWQIGNGVAR